MLSTRAKITTENISDSEYLRARIRVAQKLAIGNNPRQALRALAELRPLITLGNNAVCSLYFQAYAIANIKAGLIDEGFNAFELALGAARLCGDPAVCAKTLNNYGTAAVYSGRVDVAIALLEEALDMHRSLGSSTATVLVSLAEALFAAGDLQRAALLLHEFHAIENEKPATTQCDDSTLLLGAGAVGIPLALMLDDAPLLRLCSDPALLQLGFAGREQWLAGPIVEAFCELYEHDDKREDHDALLERAVDSLSSLDNSLPLGIRVARLGTAHQVPRISTLMSWQCGRPSRLLHGYKDLFDSYIASRLGTLGRAKKLGLQAAQAFASVGRPLMQARALEAAGLAEEADDVRRRCGTRSPSMRLRFTGAPLQTRLATQLTPRETEVAKLAGRGSSDHTIATILGISERTVQRHCESIFNKLGIRSRWQLSASFRTGSENDCE